MTALYIVLTFAAYIAVIAFLLRVFELGSRSDAREVEQ